MEGFKRQHSTKFQALASGKDNIPPNFKLSPVAMIPHKSRAFRGILDLSFQLRHANPAFKSVNENTTKTSNHHSMTQLGSALKRIIATMATVKEPTNSSYFPNWTSKTGFEEWWSVH